MKKWPARAQNNSNQGSNIWGAVQELVVLYFNVEQYSKYFSGNQKLKVCLHWHCTLCWPPRHIFHYMQIWCPHGSKYSDRRQSQRVNSDNTLSAQRTTRPRPEPLVDTLGMKPVGAQWQNLHLVSNLEHGKAYRALPDSARTVSAKARPVLDDGQAVDGGLVEPRTRRRAGAQSTGGWLAAADARVEEVDQGKCGDEE